MLCALGEQHATTKPCHMMQNAASQPASHCCHGTKHRCPAHLVPGPKVHSVFGVLCSHEVVMAQRTEAVAAAAVGLVLSELRAGA